MSVSPSTQNAQRLGVSQVTQPLTTPVVSVATPSLLAPFPGMQTAYNTGKPLNAALPPTMGQNIWAAWTQFVCLHQDWDETAATDDEFKGNGKDAD